MEIASFGKDSLPRHADHDTATKTFLYLKQCVNDKSIRFVEKCAINKGA